jgi:dTDP-4-dehydrorhamnose reductase
MSLDMGDEVRVLVLGASGMLGNAVFRFLSSSPGHAVTGSIRSSNAMALLPRELHGRIVSGVEMYDLEGLMRLFDRTLPDVVVNCVGLVKQLPGAEDALTAIPLNALLPHRLLALCKVARARLIHVSTDCVFDGARGKYRESDFADATDLYGRSKYLGELHDPLSVTLRTSIIGPELGTAHGLLGWFLAQRGQVKGFTRAIFSGLPTVELARVIRDFVIPAADLSGLYHVSSAPISKYELLRGIAREYGHAIEIVPDAELVIDRSLDSSRFRERTGYVAPVWQEMLRVMHEFG